MRELLHDVLGWGYPTELKEADSFQPVYGCRFCDGRLAQDSQGNWFHLGNFRIKPLKRLACALVGHKWLFMEAQYKGELDGKWCERCDKEVGKRI